MLEQLFKAVHRAPQSSVGVIDLNTKGTTRNPLEENIEDYPSDLDIGKHFLGRTQKHAP